MDKEVSTCEEQNLNTTVHLCSVFHSTCNPIILKRNATKLRMLQDHDKNQSLNFTQAIWCDNPKCNGDPRVCTCCIASSYSGSLLGKCIRITIRKREHFVLLCNERGKEDKQTRVITTYQRVRERCANSNLCLHKEGARRKTVHNFERNGKKKKKVAVGRRWSSTQNNVLLHRKYYCGNGNGNA